MLSPENLKKQIEQFWPTKGPSAKEVSKYIKKYHNEKIVIKCGGKVLLDPILLDSCLLYTSPSPRDGLLSRMPSSA